MQARRSISLLVVSTVTALLGVSAHADDGTQTLPVQAVVPGLVPGAEATSAAQADAPDAVAAPRAPGAPDAVAGATAPASGTTRAATAAPSRNDGFGVAMTADQLDAQRGGDALIGQNYLTGDVANNTANRVTTGSNSISEGSFASSSGLPTVIQNTGANVLIQNATVLNVRFGN